MQSPLRLWLLLSLLGMGAVGLADETEAPCLRGGKDGLQVRSSPRCVQAFREQGLGEDFKGSVQKSVTRPAQKAKKEDARKNLQLLMQKSDAERPPKRGYYGQQ